MALFKKKKDPVAEKIVNMSEEKKGGAQIDRPRICTIDLSEKSIAILHELGFPVFEGTLGKTIELPKIAEGSFLPIILRHHFPSNLHEYDIVIIDLNNEQFENYASFDHSNHSSKGARVSKLIAQFPSTFFDPRPYAVTELGNLLHNETNKITIIVVFACAAYQIAYESIEIVNRGASLRPTEVRGIYGFEREALIDREKNGKMVQAGTSSNIFTRLLTQYSDEIEYFQTFRWPYAYKEGTNVDDPAFAPILMNGDGDIISCLYSGERIISFYFPEIVNKPKFLEDLLTDSLPSVLPEIFPHSTRFAWRNQDVYMLPNEEILSKEKSRIENENADRIREIDSKIEQNKKKFEFLHDLITETDSKLVIAIQSFLYFLGFKTVIITDEDSNSIKEEDLQVNLENGILIIESKGIGGTSTDSDCSQIAKIKMRRCKDRKKFDVWALYVVNHQRYLPPFSRRNPPFSDHQISDAESDERGLVTTWQLYNLYFDIQQGIIKKEGARKALLKFGLIEFIPETKFKLNRAKQLLKKDTVIIVDINGHKIKVGQTLIFKSRDRYSKIKIISLQINGQVVHEAESCEVGIELDQPIKKSTELLILD
jgi:hypothetical protein